MPLTIEEFTRYTNEIQNHEVPSIMFSMLSKVHGHLEKAMSKMSEIEVSHYGMFKVFFKQYNTILSITRGLNYLYSPEYSYIDIKSTYVLIRSCHELYLTFNYLVTHGVLTENDAGEIEFKFKCYSLSGIFDNERTFELTKNFEGQKSIYLQEIAQVREKKRNLLSEIEASPIYATLSDESKRLIGNGRWRVGVNGELSWNDLLQFTPLAKKYGQLEYHLLSMYAHSSHNSLLLEAQHDYNIEGILFHLYILSALFMEAILRAHGLDFGFFPKREEALITEFYVFHKK
ncbi:DUF5677 domain-containing protein [Massilia norwichensis]|uniref:DUF5677 domain-containing protein n=2 Tax=Massilia norwichensis TaxID=1442366 RepID=A0ABT2A9A8_9BURK|nr:DUF5677 domain-containing protein [Massilia norwichensis]MCS0590695.1 DUF5677 domain-containing protein [Massilia norwichensis]